MYRVLKRDGKVVDFNLSKISVAITKAFDAMGKTYNTDIIDLLALKVTADYQDRIKNGAISVEQIQDSVENVLIKAGYGDVAKAYILYRKQREKIRNLGSTVLDYKELVNNYLHVNDWRVKENSTVTYSVGGLILSNSGAITANYWLSEIYDPEIAEAHKSGDLHIHDLSMMGLCPTGVKITAAQKRYGSCSAKNSLCFSCYLMRSPDEAIDAVVVHDHQADDLHLPGVGLFGGR